jgi:MFS family permease
MHADGTLLVSATLALLTYSGMASPHLLYASTMLLALFSSLEQPSRQSLIPNLVPRQDLAQALALQGTQRYVPMIAGPSLAGIVLAFSGPAACYTIDALSWLAMLLALLLLRTKISEGGGLRTVSLRSLKEGIGFVWRHGIILPLMLLDFGATFFGNVRGLLPIYARDILFVGPTGLGVLYAARAVGSVSAAAAMSFRGPVRRGGLWVFIGVGIYGLATVLFAYSGMFWFSVLMLTLTGVGELISRLRGTINQLQTRTSCAAECPPSTAFYHERPAARPIRNRHHRRLARQRNGCADRRAGVLGHARHRRRYFSIRRALPDSGRVRSQVIQHAVPVSRF